MRSKLGKYLFGQDLEFMMKGKTTWTQWIKENSEKIKKSIGHANLKTKSVGSLLAVPVLIKNNVELESNCKIYTCASQIQGWRDHMEDYLAIKFNLSGAAGWHYYAVFDGHIDERVAKYCSENLPKYLEEKLEPIITSKEEINLIRLKKIISNAYLEFDDILRRQGLRSGSTCTSVIVTPNFYLFANVGDSRTLLVTDGQLRFETEDHKPENPDENRRIYENGGFVRYRRVNGNLALSRAFGDFDFKRHHSGLFSKVYSPLNQPVIAAPTMTIVPKNDNDELMILGSDGIFDVFPQSSVLADYVTNRFKVYGKSQIVANEIIDTSFARGSMDNMTILLVALNTEINYFSESENQKDSKLNELIKNKVDNLSKAHMAKMNPESLLYKIFMDISKDEDIQALLPPGAALSGKSAFIKQLFHDNITKT